MTVMVFLVPYHRSSNIDEPLQPTLPAAIEQSDLDITDQNQRRFARITKKLALTPFVHPTLLFTPNKSCVSPQLERLKLLDFDKFQEKIKHWMASK
jgi:hypothetical protein